MQSPPPRAYNASSNLLKLRHACIRNTEYPEPFLIHCSSYASAGRSAMPQAQPACPEVAAALQPALRKQGASALAIPASGFRYSHNKYLARTIYTILYIETQSPHFIGNWTFRQSVCWGDPRWLLKRRIGSNHGHVNLYINTYIYIYTSTHIHMHIQIYIYIYTFTYTYACTYT